jgi:coenzyme F420-0:L-glutamate ligase/coenzyme F420-1:gamma-L-glutamate ligase
MELFTIKFPLIKENDDLLKIIIKNIKKQGESLKEGDIIVIAEKVIATSQGRVITLSNVTNISEKAKKMAKEYDMDERFVELIIQEASMIL